MQRAGSRSHGSARTSIRSWSLLAPLWWIYPGPELLLIVQAAALAAGIYPAVRLALKYTESALVAGLLGAWYLVFPWIVWNAFDDFHPVTLAIPLLLYAIWFLDEHRFRSSRCSRVSRSLPGSSSGSPSPGLGLWYALRHRRFRVGGAISLAGTAWTVVAVAVIVPAFSEGEASRYYDRFESVGGSPTGLLKKLVHRPVSRARATHERDGHQVCRLAPRSDGVPCSPDAGPADRGAASARREPLGRVVHRGAADVPLRLGTRAHRDRRDDHGMARFSARARVVAAGVALGAAVLILPRTRLVPGAQTFVFPETYPSERRNAMREALELIPPSVPVTATNRLGAHLSARRIIQLFPERRGAEWAVSTRAIRGCPASASAPDPRDFRRAVDRSRPRPGLAAPLRP